MSKDPEQEYFSDGLTEVLTGDLSKISSLFVIARNSAFTYKGKAVNVQDVSRETGGALRAGRQCPQGRDQVRITTQLIDATQDRSPVVERYDRPLKDIFALQDEIGQKIVTTLKLQLTLEEQGFQHANQQRRSLRLLLARDGRPVCAALYEARERTQCPSTADV